MTVFKAYFKVAQKYKMMIFLYTGIFLILSIIVLKFSGPTTTEEYMDQSINFSVVDNDHSDVSQGLVNFLAKKHRQVAIETTPDAYLDAIYNRETSYILIIPKGYGISLSTDSPKELESYKLPGSMSADFLETDLNSFLNTFRSYLILGQNPNDAYNNSIETMSFKADATIYNQTKTSQDSSNFRYYNYFTYVMISIIISGIAPILIRFNNEDLKKRTAVSTVSLLQRNIALTCGSGLYTCGITVFFCILSLFIAPPSSTQMFWIQFSNAMLYAFICLSIAFLISSITSKEAALSMLANVIGLSSSFLCGVFVPRSLLSDTVISIGRFLPAYWYVNIEEELENSGVLWNSTIAISFLVQILYFVAIMVLAILVTQFQRKKS